MRRPFTPRSLRIGIVFVIVASPAAAFAQQGQGGGELPPPTLDVPAPAAQTVPSPAATAAPAPAVTVPPAAATPAGVPERKSAAAPVSTAPVYGAPVSDSPASDAGQPWYKRAWGRVTGWFSGEERASDPAPAVASAAEPRPVAPPAASRGSGPVEGYAVDSPERVVRTGVLGECVKTGTWHEGAQAGECGGAASQAGAVAQAEPVAAPQPAPEPVEVQPLPTPAEEPQAPLAAEAEPEPAPAPPAPSPRETMTLSADALFAVNSDVLKPAARDSLDALARKLAGMEYETVEVVGHTDPTGSASLNDRLSRRRAEAVKRHLIEQGVPGDRISAQGVGSSMPVVDPATCRSLPKGKRGACFQPDRRVDIEVTGTVPSMAGQ